MNKLYQYTDEKAKDWAEKYQPYLKDVNAAVFFLGENYDAAQLKIELNHIVAKGYDLFCVLDGNPVFDSGISLQMGLSTKIANAEDAPQKLAELLKKKEKPQSHKGLIIGVLAVLVIAAVFIFLNPAKEEKTAADNLSLNETYTKALIAAGADSIVVDGGISKEEMLLLESLDLSGLGIESIEPLLYATNLKELNLSNNNIKDITDIVALSKLEKLNLSGNPIENYSVLDYLKELTEVIK